MFTGATRNSLAALVDGPGEFAVRLPGRAQICLALLPGIGEAGGRRGDPVYVAPGTTVSPCGIGLLLLPRTSALGFQAEAKKQGFDQLTPIDIRTHAVPVPHAPRADGAE